MAKQPLNGVLKHLHKMAAVQAYRELSDPDLLERFIGARDEAAFTVLIDRHGPMVLGVCRRALPNFHDAEDACQATFLVLARKAASVRKKSSLGSWLHGVACRAAANLKRDHARRKAHERGVDVPAPKDPAAEISWREVQTILDEELQRLPDRYRAPLVLCYLECMTRDEAAHQLGLPRTTLRGRLERARDMLRERVARRDLSLAALMSAAVLGESVAQAALPSTFVVSSTKAAIMLAAGRPFTDGVVATQVITLMQEVTKAMFLARLKVGTAAVLCAGLFVALVGGSFTSLLFAQDTRPARLGEIVPGTEKNREAITQGESDTDFIRRVSKEVRGTEPTPAEIHFFASSKDAGRRQKLIDLFTQERQAKEAPAKRVELRARVTGYLIKVHVKAGETVRKDQVLFEIDPRPYKAALDAAEAKLQLADANGKFSEEKLKRAKALHDRGALTQEDYGQAVTDHAATEAGRKLAAAGVALARLNLEYTKIAAFIDGKIGAPALNVGNLVTADVTPLAVIDSVETVPMKQNK